MAAERRFNEALRALVDALDALPAPSMIIRDIGEALDHPERIDAFDALVRRVRSAKT